MLLSSGRSWQPLLEMPHPTHAFFCYSLLLTTTNTHTIHACTCCEGSHSHCIRFFLPPVRLAAAERSGSAISVYGWCQHTANYHILRPLPPEDTYYGRLHSFPLAHIALTAAQSPPRCSSSCGPTLINFSPPSPHSLLDYCHMAGVRVILSSLASNPNLPRFDPHPLPPSRPRSAELLRQERQHRHAS